MKEYTIKYPCPDDQLLFAGGNAFVCDLLVKDDITGLVNR